MMLLLLACRPDPGAPDYPQPGEWQDTAGGDFLPGDDPFEEGDLRLSLGLFYEGEATETVLVDNVDSHFYVYESSFSVLSSDDRVEGYLSDALVASRDTWWGGGIHWSGPRDLSAYDTLHVSLKSQDMPLVEVGMKGVTEAKVDAADYGYAADGDWHHVDIPLADLGVTLGSVEIPLILASSGMDTGAQVLVDNLYLDAE